jgi:hypothetical protein
MRANAGPFLLQPVHNIYFRLKHCLRCDSLLLVMRKAERLTSLGAGEIEMKRLLISVAATLSLATPGFAQGLPAGVSPQVYGSHAFPNKQYENGTVFSKLFGHKSIKDANATGTDAEPR